MLVANQENVCKGSDIYSFGSSAPEMDECLCCTDPKNVNVNKEKHLKFNLYQIQKEIIVSEEDIKKGTKLSTFLGEIYVAPGEQVGSHSLHFNNFED